MLLPLPFSQPFSRVLLVILLKNDHIADGVVDPFQECRGREPFLTWVHLHLVQFFIVNESVAIVVDCFVQLHPLLQQLALLLLQLVHPTFGLSIGIDVCFECVVDSVDVCFPQVFEVLLDAGHSGLVVSNHVDQVAVVRVRQCEVLGNRL